MSKIAESLKPGVNTGLIFWRSSPNRRLAKSGSRAANMLMLPRRVFISPLCAKKRNGWASGQEGSVLVLYRWWISAIADWNSGSRVSR
ncbi:MAG: hypothetical protein BWX80_04013 [Candidatus Hydrogenedentes bacterium ADurb.Bin101]|nr:MAG: hypothetical protein BWX80_04013 [Candidatus Hydrogenedentes bacterium ADurb.Bin101]